MIFLVEDDPLVSRMYERVFKLERYEVEMAFNGEEAVSKLALISSLPTVILLDILMPKMSGFDFLRHIKQQPVLSDIPIVVLTNLAGVDDAEKALAMGAVMYLVKSQYDAKQIVNKIEEIVGAYTRTNVKDNLPEVKVPTKDLPDIK